MTANLDGGISPIISRAVSLARGGPGAATAETVSCGSLDEDECLALCDEEGCSVVATTSTMRTLTLGVYFILWFALSTGYNITNKVKIGPSDRIWWRR